MTRIQTTPIEESVLRSARAYLYGHPLAWELPAQRDRPVRAQTARRRLPELRGVLFRALGRRSDVAEAGGCA